jgi:predicted transcriptional regulator
MAFRITPGVRHEIERIIDERIAEAHVTREDFRELKNIVQELAEAQKRTEVRLEELAEAQKRTEVRLEELAEAQKRTEMRLEELAEAQKRTEARLEELAEAQKRTEARLEELAEAQRKTELAVNELAIAMKETRRDLGGLARSVSYGFENEVYRLLPAALKRDYGIEVKEKFVRKLLRGKEINILGRGLKDGREVVIVGEVKLRLEYKEKRAGEIDVFDELDEKATIVKEEWGAGEVVKIVATHIASDEFIEKARERGVIIIQSFEL